MNHASLFTGIGGFDLAAQWCDWKNVFQVEISSAARERLRENFPNATQYEDVKTFNGAEYAGQIDVLSGGFPCQDLSKSNQSGSQGLDGPRSSLWFEFERIIRNTGPGYVVIENSPRLLVRGFERVLAGLARLGYDAKWATLRASDFGAPHSRERLYCVAYANRLGRAAIPNWPECLAENQSGAQQQGHRPSRWDTPSKAGYEAWLPTLARFRGLDDGLPLELAKNEFHGYGNAIVPDIAHDIFQAIEAARLNSRRAASQAQAPADISPRQILLPL